MRIIVQMCILSFMFDNINLGDIFASGLDSRIFKQKQTTAKYEAKAKQN